MNNTIRVLIIFLIFTGFYACQEEEAMQAEGPFLLEKIEILKASSIDGQVLPYSSSEGPRLFLRFGPYQGTFPAYQSRRSRQVTEMPVTWGFADDSIMVDAQDWYIALYEFNNDFGEDLLFSQKLSVLEYKSPVSLTDTEGKFRIDLHYNPTQE